MAHLRQGLLCRHGLFADRLQVRASGHAHVDVERDGHHTGRILCHCSRGQRADEESKAVRHQRPVHVAQLLLDRHQRHPASSLH